MDMDETVRQATQRLREQQARLRKLREQVKESRTTVRSADGMVTVVVDGQGELASLTFNTARYRQMAPAELAAAIVKTISKARAESREELLHMYGQLMPGRLGPSGSVGGQADLDRMFDDVVQRGTELLAGDGLTGAARRTDRHKEGDAYE